MYVAREVGGGGGSLACLDQLPEEEGVQVLWVWLLGLSRHDSNFAVLVGFPV